MSTYADFIFKQTDNALSLITRIIKSQHTNLLYSNLKFLSSMRIVNQIYIKSMYINESGDRSRRLSVYDIYNACNKHSFDGIVLIMTFGYRIIKIGCIYEYIRLGSSYILKHRLFRLISL
jgi:hypothetical protein